jgi:hypothetical protein
VAPLLKSFSSKYSTFWTVTDDYNIKALDSYDNIYNRKSKGCFKVTGVHDCFLLDLTSSKTKNLLDIDETITNEDFALVSAAKKASM